MSGPEVTSDDVRKALGAHTFRSGFLKLSILRILAERPLHGYALMKEIERITGTWKPSPGSLYPALQSLQRDGLINLSSAGRQRTYEITPDGKVILDSAVVHVQAWLHNVQNLLEYQYPDDDHGSP